MASVPPRRRRRGKDPEAAGQSSEGPTRSVAIHTFLIADIRGYTRFTAEQGDERAANLATKFAEIVAEGVEAWGGETVELRGDEALAVFDSPRAAIRAAVDLQAAFGNESVNDPSLPLGVGIGLDVGEAVAVGEGYRGAALNLAARLCSAAAAGEIYATQQLIHLAGHVDRLDYAPLRTTDLKGVEGEVAVIGIRDPDGAASRALPRPAGVRSALPPDLDPIVPLAGRVADLRFLAWHWRRARLGHGRAVVLAGQPGIGKTRLAAELATKAHAGGGTVVYLPSARGTDDSRLTDLATSVHPTLLIVDDLDAAPVGFAEAVAGLEVHLSPRPVLLVVTHREGASETLARIAERVAPPERRRRLGPLDREAVQAIAALYAGSAADSLPLDEILTETGGVPAAVHRVASQRARLAAEHRLGESADRTVAGRRVLRAAEEELIGNVSDLEVARDRARLYLVSVDGEESGEPVAICPYKGLASFEAADARYYFGRERLVAELVARLVGSSFLGLVGASGSGKSSALAAGLVPALAGGVLPGSDGWPFAELRPGEHPLTELGRSLARAFPDAELPDDAELALKAALRRLAPGQRLVMVIDQFEEAFTATRNQQEVASFIDLLTSEHGGLKVIVSLRADHYGHCAAYPSLARVLAANHVLVGPLTQSELAAVIEHPAEQVGLRVDKDLVEALTADVGDEPSALPLLSTALLELWQVREAGRLTLGGYRVTGGLRGAVARLAEAAFARLTAAQQVAARGVFLRLAGPGEGEGVVRRRVAVAEFEASDPSVDEVLKALTDGRLLTSGDYYIEVAHEALLREWPRLQGWLEEDAAGRQLRLHVIRAAHDWDVRGRDSADLYRGARLAAALDWSTEHLSELNATERAYLEESRGASEREAERQSRINQRLRALLAAAAVLLAVAVGAGVFAARSAAVAQGRELYAAVVAVVEQDPELAILLALEAAALGVDPDPEALSALHRAVQEARTIAAFALAEPAVRPTHVGVALSPDGRTLYAATDSGSIQVFDVESGEAGPVLGTPREDTRAGYLAVAVSPDGRRVALVAEDTVAHVWDVVDGREWQLDAEGDLADIAVFSPDGGRLATLTFVQETEEAIVTLFDVKAQNKIQEWRLEAGYTIGFHPDGEYLLASACPCRPEYALQRLDIATGEVVVVEVPEVLDRNPTSAQFSPDGGVLATAGADGTINLWETGAGDLLTTFRSRTQWVNALTFSPDGTRLASSSRDGTTQVWDVQTGASEMILRGQGGLPGLASFSADGSRLATASTNLTARVWDVSRVRAELEGAELGPEYREIWDLAVRGDVVGVLGGEGRQDVYWRTALSLDLASGRRTDLGTQIGTGVALAPGGPWLISQAAVPHRDLPTDLALGPLRAYDLETGDVALEFDGICPYSAWDPFGSDETAPACGIPPDVPWDEQINSIRASLDGSLVAATGFFASGHVMTWNQSGDLTGGPVPITDVNVDDTNKSLAVSPDGSLIAAGTWAKGVVVLVAPGLSEHEVLDVQQANDLRFSPNGSSLAVSAATTETRIYDVATWSFRALGEYSFGVDFSPDGSALATYDTDGKIRIWDSASGGLLQEIPLERTYTQPYGSLWTRRGHVRFLDDERVIVADRGALQVLTLVHEELFEIGRSRVTRSLTDKECRNYLHADTCPASKGVGTGTP